MRNKNTLLAPGKPPPKAIGKYTGEFWNYIRRYHRESNIAKDGLLEVKADADWITVNTQCKRIVISKPLVLAHMHNNLDEDPAGNQQKAQFL